MVELRSPDAAANPYLVLAVCLAAGMDGIRKRLVPLKAVETEHPDCLPETLKEAIDIFENSSWIREILGEDFCRIYVESKKKEWLRYTRQVTDWEVEEYLYRL